MKMQAKYKVVNVISKDALNNWTSNENNHRDDFKWQNVYNTLYPARLMAKELFKLFSSEIPYGRYANYVVLEQHVYPRKTGEDKVIWHRIVYSANPAFEYSDKKISCGG